MKIAIIAGHATDTAGKRTPAFTKNVDIDGDGVFDILKGTQFKEHYANVGVCVELDAALKRCGFETVRVGWDDEDPTNDTLMDDSAGLAKRQALVKASGADTSISVHFNAFGDGVTFNSADGICTFIHSTPAKAGDSATLAKLVQAELALGTKQRDRGVLTGAFAEINCQAMGTKGSILVELAFMTNQREAEELMANKAFWIECAEEICKGFCAYYGIAYVAPRPAKKSGVFNTIEEVPEYGKKTIQKLIDLKALQGTGSGLNLSEDMLRVFVILDRLGKL